MTSRDYILGIDYGEKRVGVAIAQKIAKLPRPLDTLANDQLLISRLHDLIETECIAEIIVGVPRQMSGEMSEQSDRCEAFAVRLSNEFSIPVRTTDETLSSVEAEKRLVDSKATFAKSQIDAMAAAIILERYFDNQTGLQTLEADNPGLNPRTVKSRRSERKL